MLILKGLVLKRLLRIYRDIKNVVVQYIYKNTYTKLEVCSDHIKLIDFIGILSFDVRVC